jgi:outer membrane biogenesis lipoprotein LolB
MRRYALLLGVAAVLLTGCGAHQSASPSSGDYKGLSQMEQILSNADTAADQADKATAADR